MKTSKHFLFAAALMLLAGLGAAAMAQGRIASSPVTMPPDPIGGISNVNAIEVSDGTIGYDSQTKQETAFGYSFLGQTSGGFPGSFTLAMNCAPAKPIPGATTEVKSGSWTLPVYVTGLRSVGYLGSLYGTITKGTMYWDKAGTNAAIYIVLNVDGGTQSWDGITGYATFTGTLAIDEKTDTTTLTGDLAFNIIGAP